MVHAASLLKSAIALNNAAVGLLARGHAHAAVETLKDAIVLIKQYKSLAPHNDSSSPRDVALDARLLFDTACQRVAQCSQSIVRGPKLAIHVVSSEYNVGRVLDLLTARRRHGTVVPVFPMTIDSELPVHWESVSQNNYHVNFEASVILYNYAIAIDCIARYNCQDAESRSSCTYLHGKAYHMCKRSRLLLSKAEHVNDSQIVGSLGLLNDGNLCRALLLQTLVTHGLLHLSMQCHAYSAYETHLIDMKRTWQCIELWQSLVPDACRETESSTAAAA
jgi:hypothetical protein